MKPGRAAALTLWLAVLALCAVWLTRHFVVNSDLTVFLPASSTPQERLLIGQLRDGVASRLILVALGGADEAALARASRSVARELRASGLFSFVNNGEADALHADRELLLRHRYLLSPAVEPERFSTASLKAGLDRSLELLASPAGPWLRPIIPLDPTGELQELLGLIAPQSGPLNRQGVWFSRTGERAMLVAQTAAAGFDVAAQRNAVKAIESAVAAALPAKGNVELAGPGVFASHMRDAIETESWRLSLVAALLVLGILWLAYRSVSATLACALPAAVGLLVGVTAVIAGFGSVHGITLAFGATLIGEAVDYPSYLFLHAAPQETLWQTLDRIGNTLRLAALTTMAGALAMAFSSFKGLAQLGILTIAGVAAAGATTLWILPLLVPASALRRKPLPAATLRRRAFSPAFAIAVLAVAVGVIASMHERLWNDDLANLSPIPDSAKQLDRRMRAELGAPDLRYLAVARAASTEAALEESEALAHWLRGRLESGELAGFEVPSTYLPSRRTQQLRQAALPDASTLDARLKLAMRDSPFRGGVFAPFLEAVDRTRSGPLVDAAALQGSMLGLKVSSLLVQDEGGWAALAPLRGIKDPQQFALAAAKQGYVVLDLKEETNRLVNRYRNQSLRLFLFGLLCIVLLLAVSLRSPLRAMQVLLPVAAAVVADVMLLLLLGRTLSLFNLVALLLVVGVGLNYALFFERPQASAADAARTRVSVTVCAITTLSVFGCLMFSATPVLKSIGETVFIGCLLSVILCYPIRQV
jgi:predicted exporter